MNVASSVGQTVLLAAHLLCVNVAMVSPLACVLLRIRATRKDDQMADQAGRTLCNLSMWALLVAIVLGLISGLLYWLENRFDFFLALQSVPPGRLYWGIVEIAFYFLCMLIYYGLWNRWSKRYILHSFLAVVAATNLMYHFPPLFIAINTMASAGDVHQPPLETKELMKLMFSPSALSQLAHHLVAAVAGTAVWLMLVVDSLSRHRKDHFQDRDGKQRALLVRRAAIAALVATLSQLPVGLWLLLKLPADERSVLMGGSWMAAGLFIAAMFAALGLLHSLSILALGQIDRRDIINAVALLVLVTVLMTGVLRASRRPNVGGLSESPPTDQRVSDRCFRTQQQFMRVGCL